jgi:hypothetical protein
MFFDDKTDLDVEENVPLPPYPQQPVSHDTASQTSTSKLPGQRLCEDFSLTIMIVTHSTAHESRASEEVIAASFPDDDDYYYERPAPPYSIDDLLAVN